MMNADIEALVLSGELFNPSNSRSSSPRRSPSPDHGWHDDLLQNSDSETKKNDKITPGAPRESIGMGPGRTGVKGVIKDRDEANEIHRQQSQLSTREKASQWNRGNLGGKTYLEEEREKALRNEIYGLDEKVDSLVLDEQLDSKERGGGRSRSRGVKMELNMFGERKRGKFGHLREVGVKGYVEAVEKEDRGVWVIVHLYDPSLDRCYALDSTLSQLARLHPETKFIRARASKLGFTSSSSSSSALPPRSSQRLGGIRTSRPLNTIDSDDDEDDPYADGDTQYKDEDECDEEDEYDDDDDDDDDVDLDMLPTLLVYRDGELVHNWVRVDWVTKDLGGGGGGSEDGGGGIGKGVQELLEKHHVLSHTNVYGGDSEDTSGDLVFSNNLGLPSDDDDDEDEDDVWDL